jgi:hypothetical protein
VINTYLDLGGKRIAVDVEDESSFKSKHTCSDLRRIKVSLVLQTPFSHRKFLVGVKRAELDGISAFDEAGNPSGRWKIVDDFFSYIDGENGTEYWHTLQLDEIEELQIEGLSIAGMALCPYMYEEEFDCDDLSITARVVVTHEQSNELKNLMMHEGYFPVIRLGINDQPREMRFGKTILWSKYHHSIKYELILLDRGFDERDSPMSSLLQPQMSRMQHMVAAQSEMLEGMLNILRSKGLLSDEDINAMRTEAAKQVWDKVREFYEVKDLDESIKPKRWVAWD